MKKEELIEHRDRIKDHLVVWIVLTICLQILTVFHILAFLKYVVWLMCPQVLSHVRRPLRLKITWATESSYI